MLETMVFDDVTQIKLSSEMDGRPVYWVAAYLVDGLLVDTGCANTAEELVAFLEGRQLNRVVNTHYHEDHVGANALIKRRFNVDAYIHPNAKTLLKELTENPLPQYRELAWGIPELTEMLPLPTAIETDDYLFEVIETPGHTKDHIVLLEREKGWCFTGDLFISEGQRLIRAEDDAAALIRSMERVAALETAAGNLILFTGVGRIVEDGRAALRAAAHHLADLARKANALEKKGLSISAIRDELIGEESTLAQLTDGAFSGEHLIRAVLKVEID